MADIPDAKPCRVCEKPVLDGFDIHTGCMGKEKEEDDGERNIQAKFQLTT